MLITIFNKKGGVGKTSLSFSIAKDLDYFLLSNDDSIIEKIYPNKAKILDKVKIYDDKNVIYDLGGFIDRDINNLFKKSNLNIVPTVLDVNSIKRTINSVMEINEYNKNILIIVNRVKKISISEYENALKHLKELKKDILFLRESKAITNSVHEGQTITELYFKNGLSKNAYKGIYSDYLKILQYIKKRN